MRVLSTIFIYFMISPLNALYEDQAGKFDWFQSYVGHVDEIIFDDLSSPPRRAIVSTNHNVLAALSTKNGDILWRHVFEQDEYGKIEALITYDQYVSIVNGNLLRTWDLVSAALVEEVLLDFQPYWSEFQRYIFSFGKNKEDVHLVTLSDGKANITTFDTGSGAALNERTLSGQFLNANAKCNIASSSLICLDFSQRSLKFLSLVGSETFSSVPFSNIGMKDVHDDNSVVLGKVPGERNYLTIKVKNSIKLIHIHDDGVHLVKDFRNVLTLSIDKEHVYTISQSLQTINIQAFDLSTGVEFTDIGLSASLPIHSGLVEKFSVHQFDMKDGTSRIRAMIVCSDHSVHMIGSAGMLWSREEALSNILVTEAVDLPAAGAAENYEDQISLNSGIVRSFLHRMKAHLGALFSLKNLIIGQQTYDQMPIALERDRFNLHKLLIVVTKSGKIFALDNWSGEIVWSVFYPSLSSFSRNKMVLFTQRTSAHFPLNPQCILVGKHKSTGNGLLIAFNPLTGEGVGSDGGVTNLGFSLSHASLIHYMDEDYIKPVLLISSDLTPHVYPTTAKDTVIQNKDSLFVYFSDLGASSFVGYSLKHSVSQDLKLTEVWNLSFGKGESIIGIHGKRGELVHSPGRVLADRSVLYKYINPNLVVVSTYGTDHINKNTLTVHLIDTVTGSILESVSHKRVTGPFHFVHSENWLIYTVYNDKFRRYEVNTLEMFEGWQQSNSTHFSSFGARPTPPIVERQSFILPRGVQAAAHTTTEKGITTKFLLFALQSGHVLQVSKWHLDPRRPMSSTGPRDEMLLPYIPEVPFIQYDAINYNKSLPRVSSIFTAPTGLESTCIVLVYGLDLFYTRLFPSKMFDVLKDDFDYFLIAMVLLCLIIAAFVTRKMAQRKALKQAWK